MFYFFYDLYEGLFRYLFHHFTLYLFYHLRRQELGLRREGLIWYLYWFLFIQFSMSTFLLALKILRRRRIILLLRNHLLILLLLLAINGGWKINFGSRFMVQGLRLFHDLSRHFFDHLYYSDHLIRYLDISHNL